MAAGVQGGYDHYGERDTTPFPMEEEERVSLCVTIKLGLIGIFIIHFGPNQIIDIFY